MHSVWRDSNPTGSSDQLGRATLVWQVGGTVSPWWDVDTLLAGDLLEVVPMAMGEVALVSAVPADYTGIVFGDVGAATRSPDVRSTFGASGLFEIGWSRPLVLDVYPLVLGCRLGPDPMGLPELTDSSETMAHRLSYGDVVGVATAVVPAVGRPELAKLCATVKPIPVEADNICGRVSCQRGTGKLLNDVQLFRRTSSKYVDATTTPIARL